MTLPAHPLPERDAALALSALDKLTQEIAA